MTRLLAAIVMLSSCAWAASAQDSTDPATPRAARGVASSIEIVFPDGTLRARPVTDPDERMLVRVTPLGEDRYSIDYLGLSSGVYDLADHLERADGRPATGLGPLPVQIVSQLPAVHGSDVFEEPRSWFGLSSRYTALMIVGGAIWLAVPIVALTRRALRATPPEPEPAPTHEPTARDLLRAALADAKRREPTTAERARLELLLYHSLLDATTPAQRADTPEDLARAISDLRRDPGTRPVVLAFERWLHTREGADASHALDALDEHERRAAPLVEGAHA